MNKKENWITLGFVGVDSGHLMICDPCYIDSMWKEVPYLDIRLYEDKETKKLFAYNTVAAKKYLSHKEVEFFDNYMSVLSTGKNANDSSVNWTEIPIRDETFSYNSVTHKEKKPYKQVRYPLGHDGLAVSFNSGYGDGYYEVMGRLNEDGAIVEVRILMDK